MTNFFPLIRGCLLGAVAAWTLIVLGIAIHFQMSFVDSASELTYVSLAVFVAAVTLATFLVILVAPCNRKVSEILRTKWELLWLGILAILWTSLAGYTTSPAAKDTEIECWEEDEDGNIVDADVQGYPESVYQARYRVLQAFAFFNCILLLALFLFILALALWHHSRGRFVIWTTRTTSVGWFDRATGFGTSRHLPAPVTQRKSSKGKVDKEFGGKAYYDEWDNEKEVPSGRKKGFNFEKGSASAKDKLNAMEEKLKDKIRPLTLNNHRKGSDYEGLIQKPLPAAKKDTKDERKASTSTPAAKPKPKQYVVKVPAAEATKPTLAPIAAKMKEQRTKESSGRPSGSGPQRQQSQRERADMARQQSRRDRATDDERPVRDMARQNSSARPKRSGSTPAGGRGTESKPTPAVPAVARRESSRTRPEGVKREPSQTRVDVVRTGSGRREGDGRDTKQHASNNPYRNTPRGRQ